MSLKKNQLIGVLLLIALILMYIPLPLIDGSTIAAIIIFLVALYSFVR
jgi:hypothetical protein